MKAIACFITIFLMTLGLNARSNKTIPHQYIVEFSYSADAAIWRLQHQEAQLERLGDILNYYLVIFPESYPSSTELMILKESQSLISYGANRVLESRGCKPNDPDFQKQWNMSYMGFEDVWCYDHGGISPQGDTIAIGLIDFGFDYRCEDLTDNIYRNYKEIPGNNLDDDQNGYIDDYLGFNARSGVGDTHDTTENHGTNCLSLIGAKGNNNYQISGANPSVKVVLCSARDDAGLIRAYSYFLKMRSDYNSSSGQKGAYIVSSSLSLGYDGDLPSEHLPLCAIYDKLGEVGILNVCAATNENENIDTYGDVPSLCPSDYLIAVTNSDRNDIKAEAGYSKNNIDLAASGEEVLVIGRRGELQTSSGCSLSAPQVAGGIAYLNQFCERFNILSNTDPSKAALLMKKFVFDGSKSIAALKEYTVTGKRFDVYGAFIEVNNYGALSIYKEADLILWPNLVHEDDIKLDVHLTRYGHFTIKIYDLNGRLVQTTDHSIEPGVFSFLKLPTGNVPYGLNFVQLIFDKTLITRQFVKI